MAMSRLQYLSDREVTDLAQLGSLEACDELVRRFRPAVLLTARQIVGSSEMAQDVAQDAFLQAFRALGQLADTARFAAWLRAITRNRARRVSQNHSRLPTTTLTALDDCGHASHEPGPLDTLLQSESQDAARAALAGLAPEYQATLQLFYYEQWPASRIAAFLSLPLTTIKWRLREGRKKVAVLLDEGEEEPKAEKQKAEKQKTEDRRPKARD